MAAQHGRLLGFLGWEAVRAGNRVGARGTGTKRLLEWGAHRPSATASGAQSKGQAEVLWLRPCLLLNTPSSRPAEKGAYTSPLGRSSLLLLREPGGRRLSRAPMRIWHLKGKGLSVPEFPLGPPGAWGVRAGAPVRLEAGPACLHVLSWKHRAGALPINKAPPVSEVPSLFKDHGVGSGCHSVEEHMLSMCEAWGSISAPI